MRITSFPKALLKMKLLTRTYFSCLQSHLVMVILTLYGLICISTFLQLAYFSYDMKHIARITWLANPNQGLVTFLLIFGTCNVNILFVIKVKNLMLIKWSYTYRSPRLYTPMFSSEWLLSSIHAVHSAF